MVYEEQGLCEGLRVKHETKMLHLDNKMSKAKEQHDQALERLREEIRQADEEQYRSECSMKQGQAEIVSIEKEISALGEVRAEAVQQLQQVTPPETEFESLEDVLRYIEILAGEQAKE